MKTLILLLFTAFLFIATNAQQAKLSPLTQLYLKQNVLSKEKANKSILTKKGVDGHLITGAIIKVSDPVKAANGLQTLGIHINTKAGNIWTMKVPVELLENFIGIEGISYIQLDEPVKPNLNIVRSNTRADSAQRGINLPLAYSGKGVVVGVIDFGFDYQHPAFYDTLGSAYRIKRVWELNTNGTPPAGYNYGNEITDTTLMKSKGTDNEKQTHGALVAGVAAGSGYGSAFNSRYRGIAYESDLVFVGVRRDSIEEQWLSGGFSDFLDGINYIFQYASLVNKPCVVNISWGSQSGPHDGTTLFNEACDNLSNAGKIIVMSAGNEGEEKIHLSKTFSPTDTLLQTFLDFVPANYKRTWIDIWGDSAKTFCAEVSLFSAGSETKSTGFFCIDNHVHDTFLVNDLSNDSCTIQFITSTAEYNGKPRLTINIFNQTLDTVLIKIKGNDGNIHLWNEYYYYGYSRFVSDFSSFNYQWAIDGNTVSTTSDMGSGKSVLLVGAHVSKKTWKPLSGPLDGYGNNVVVGKIAPFSSHGPLTTGQGKPDFTAPGLTMATSANSFDTYYNSSNSKVVAYYTEPLTNKIFYYAEFSGTSASAPVTSGIVALMLQANPGMSPSQIKKIIQQTAITDVNTGTIPIGGDNTWGYGKINAYAAVKRATQETGLYSFSGVNLNVALFPNPNQGEFMLDYTCETSEEVSIEIFDLKGTLVMAHKQLKMLPGNNLIPINLSLHEKGLYIIKIASADGVATIKTIVQ